MNGHAECASLLVAAGAELNYKSLEVSCSFRANSKGFLCTANTAGISIGW
jgi:hypothetical protein